MQDFSLILDAVSLSRGSKSLIAGLSLSVSNGDLIWICGANGVGKSSLLRLAAGFLRPDEGALAWTHNNALCRPARIMSYQGHKDPLKPTLTLFENLSFWADALDTNTDISAAIARVGLTGFEAARAGTLSAGQSRRAMLAKLLIENKPLWVLDEPSAAMDVIGVDLIDALITEHIARGGAVILASHAAPRALTADTRLLTLKPSQQAA